MSEHEPVLAGRRFGRLTVFEEIPREKPFIARRAARCVCQCGTEVVVLVQNLLKPNGTQSCGCTKRKGTMSKRFAETRATPARLSNRSHGLSKHPSYFRWHNAMSRCTNPSHRAYPNYGGRGISIYAPWLDPAEFLKWLDENLGPCPKGMSLDRIDNDGNYEPGNLRWATRSQQARNQRHKSA